MERHLYSIVCFTQSFSDLYMINTINSKISKKFRIPKYRVRLSTHDVGAHYNTYLDYFSRIRNIRLKQHRLPCNNYNNNFKFPFIFEKRELEIVFIIQ